MASLLSCSFCNRPNPSDAKFCNECGSPLNFQPCVHCDAVNDVHAERCHACNEPLAATPSRPEDGAPEQATSPHASSGSSIVQALETIEADLAAFAHPRIDAGRAHPVVAADGARSARRTRQLGSVLVTTAALCGLFAVFYGEKRMSLPDDLSPAASAATIGAVANEPPKRAVERMQASTVPPVAVPKASPRTSSGQIESAPQYVETATSRDVASSPRGTSVSPQPTAQDGTRSQALPSIVPSQPTVHDQPPSSDASALPYPVPAERCTDGVAAMGLCKRERATEVGAANVP